MTESLIPFDHDEDAPRVRRSVLLAGVGAAVVAGAAAVVLLGGSTEESAEQLVPLSAAVRAPQAQAAAAAPAPAGAPVGTVLKVPGQHTEDIARNPFKARYVEPPPPEPAAAPPAAAPAVPGAQPGTIPLPLPLPLSPPGGDAPVQRAPEPAEPVVVEYPITLASVGEPQGEVRLVTWTIDDKEVEVVPGQRFGRFGELVVLAYLMDEAGGQVKGVLLQVGDANPVSVDVKETIKVL